MSSAPRSHYGNPLGRFLAVARRDGLSAALGLAVARTLPAVRRDSFLVLSLRLSETADLTTKRGTSGDRRDRRRERLERMTAELVIDEITSDRHSDLYALPSFDGWTNLIEARIGWLNEGARCFIAKRDGALIASTWLTTANSFYEPYLKRRLDLSPHESYSWGSYCVVDRRGQGVMPRLIDHAMNVVAAGNDKHEFTMIVRPSNRLSLRPSEKIGFERVGRIGFIDAFGTRLHYILGRKAFKHTRRRLSLQRTG